MKMLNIKEEKERIDFIYAGEKHRLERIEEKLNLVIDFLDKKY